MESLADTKHFKINYNGGKKYDTKEDLLKDLGIEELKIDHENVEEITLSGNSYGQGVCDYIASILSLDTPKLRVVNFSDMFVGRKLLELPGSLEVLVRSLMGKQIVELDLSHNAFGPTGIKSFDFLLKEMSCLKVLKCTNCGLGPEGGEMIANALKENIDLKLVQFSAGRDRLENKGISALASVFESMGTLEVIEVPQNGIKKEGMMALLKAFQANASSLREVYIHDNWVKGEAVDQLIIFLLKASVLQRVNISDSDMGNEKVFLLFKAIETSPSKSSIIELKCNYNEVTSSKYAEAILSIVGLHLSSLSSFEFKGNGVSKKSAAIWLSKLGEQEIKAQFHEVTSDDEGDEEEEEEEESDHEEFDQDDLIAKLEALKL